MTILRFPRFRDGVYRSLEQVKGFFLLDAATSLQYEGVYRAFFNDKVIWRFSNLGVQYLTEYLGNDVLPHIIKCLNNCIIGRQNLTSWGKYSFMTTNGFIWEALNSGVTNAITPFSGTYNIDDEVVDGSITWKAKLAWYGGHDFFWSETTTNLTGLEASLNQDSTASSVFLMVDKYISNNGDYAWLEDVSNVGGLTYHELLYNSYVNNIKNQIDTDNLCFVFQNGINPTDGGSYTFKFCFNNSEDLGGLKALVRIFSILDDFDAVSECNADIIKLVTGINSLWNSTYNIFLWNNTASPTETDNSTQIVRWLAQFGPLTYMNDSELDASIKPLAYDTALEIIPNWWKREDFNPALSLIPIHYDADVGGNYLHVTENLQYLEQTYLQNNFLEFLDTAILVRNKFKLLGDDGDYLNAIVRSNLIVNIKTINDNYTVVKSDTMILVDTTVIGNVNIQLPPTNEFEGRIITIKKITNGSTVSILPDGSETIDGNTGISLIGTREPSATLLGQIGGVWRLMGASTT